jgi:hypothetical protein
MIDDERKLERRHGVRAALIADEVRRLRGFIELLVQTTPYEEKRVAYRPAIAAIRTSSLLEDFVAHCRAEEIDITLDRDGDGAAVCRLAIHAPCPTRART